MGKSTKNPQSPNAPQLQNTRGVSETIERATASGLLDQQVPRAARFALLEEAGVPPMVARAQAGYSPQTSTTDIRKSGKYAQFKTQIREERARLSATRGYKFADSARFYRDKSEDKLAKELRRKADKAAKEGDAELAGQYLNASRDVSVSDNAQIRAREAFDKLMGYLAPIEVEQERPQEQTPVVALLQVLHQYNVTPMQLMEAAGGSQFQPLNQQAINASNPPSPPTGAGEGV